METWIAFWKFVLGGGVVVYYLLALFVLPLACRDLRALVRKLGRGDNSNADGD